jgi:hypothetical protein
MTQVDVQMTFDLGLLVEDGQPFAARDRPHCLWAAQLVGAVVGERPSGPRRRALPLRARHLAVFTHGPPVEVGHPRELLGFGGHVEAGEQAIT